jgi:hypothetical protein
MWYDLCIIILLAEAQPTAADPAKVHESAALMTEKETAACSSSTSTDAYKKATVLERYTPAPLSSSSCAWKHLDGASDDKSTNAGKYNLLTWEQCAEKCADYVYDPNDACNTEVWSKSYRPNRTSTDDCVAWTLAPDPNVQCVLLKDIKTTGSDTNDGHKPGGVEGLKDLTCGASTAATTTTLVCPTQPGILEKMNAWKYSFPKGDLIRKVTNQEFQKILDTGLQATSSCAQVCAGENTCEFWVWGSGQYGCRLYKNKTGGTVQKSQATYWNCKDCACASDDNVATCVADTTKCPQPQYTVIEDGTSSSSLIEETTHTDGTTHPEAPGLTEATKFQTRLQNAISEANHDVNTIEKEATDPVVVSAKDVRSAEARLSTA